MEIAPSVCRTTDGLDCKLGTPFSRDDDLVIVARSDASLKDQNDVCSVGATLAR
jgi:hypothetical protein